MFNCVVTERELRKKSVGGFVCTLFFFFLMFLLSFVLLFHFLNILMQLLCLRQLPHKYQKKNIPFSFPSSAKEIESASPRYLITFRYLFQSLKKKKGQQKKPTSCSVVTDSFAAAVKKADLTNNYFCAQGSPKINYVISFLVHAEHTFTISVENPYRFNLLP